ncbi:jg25268 [Pararge aegeria aegeria]|uniref:Jg25268 protein n=1 Tax=Pararge aegeria aegeria TaxID=348720 RepID=A0A8S4QQS8_9NEOP|nr:jg25268 [Pararge aegeria aegeria]
MPKRKSDEDSDEYIRRKMRKIEKKLRRRKKRSRRLSSSSNDLESICASPVLSLPEDGLPLIINDEQHGLPTQNVDLENLEPLPGPSSPVLTVSEEYPLDDDILEMLGASPNKAKKTGDNIQKDIAIRWQHIAPTGLTKETRKELLDKHLIPSNCTKLAAPLLNLEIKAALSDTLIGKDKSTEYRQNQIASAISCIGVALTKIFKSDSKDSTIIKPLPEGAQLLCDFQFCESMKRRSLICASIKKEIKSQLYETEIDTYLFGEKLADTLKAAKAISRSASEIKASKPKTTIGRPQSRALNSKPQPVTSRQPGKRRQEPAAYTQIQAVYPPPIPQQRRQYMAPLPPPPPPPPPPLLLPPPPLQSQQRSRQQRPYQRR